MSPRLLFRRLAFAEAVTWALLLTGMFLKYVTETTELGVRIGGMLHGLVFVAYAVAAVVIAIDQRWAAGRTLAALACAVPPFATVPFDLWVERQHPLADTWRLRADAATGPPERLVSWLVRSPVQGVLAGLVAVAALTGLALLVGPPTS
ncbi:MAG: DUF3817 domain-containing protein [Nocardioides sp.]